MWKCECKCEKTPVKHCHGPSLAIWWTWSHFADFLFLSSKRGPKFTQYFQRYLTTCQALLYTKSNLTVMTITTPKGFKIGPSTTEIRGVSKVTLAMNNPVHETFSPQYRGQRLHELAPAATGGQDARTLKLSPDIMGNTVYCRLSEQKKCTPGRECTPSTGCSICSWA